MEDSNAHVQRLLNLLTKLVEINIHKKRMLLQNTLYILSRNIWEIFDVYIGLKLNNFICNRLSNNRPKALHLLWWRFLKSPIYWNLRIKEWYNLLLISRQSLPICSGCWNRQSNMFQIVCVTYRQYCLFWRVWCIFGYFTWFFFNLKILDLIFWKYFSNKTRILLRK